MRALAGLIAGLIFGAGLAVSGMADPAKVLNFLDIAGRWDPSLAFVMAGAVAVSFVGFRLAWRRPAPLLMDRFDLPAATAVDRRLVAGAAIFGVGWGIGGFCPGPAITSLALAEPGTLVFVPAMAAGLWLGFRARGAGLPSSAQKEST
jgi:uncharacterized membrane protein YedE/YeeE